MAATLKEMMAGLRSGIKNPGFHDAHIETLKMGGNPDLALKMAREGTDSLDTQLQSNASKPKRRRKS